MPTESRPGANRPAGAREQQSRPHRSTGPRRAPLRPAASNPLSMQHLANRAALRLPPIAARTASSRSRDAARTSRRFETFAHAMSRTKATAPKSERSTGRTCAVRSACSSSTRTAKPAVAFTWSSAASADEIRSICAWSCSGVAPSRSRPIGRRKTLLRGAFTKSMRDASQSSTGSPSAAVGGISSSKPGGMTPTISVGAPATSATVPTTFGSPPYRCCHRAWLRIATPGRKPGPPGATPGGPGAPSSSTKARPSIGSAPITEKKFQVTPPPCTWMGSPSPVIETGNVKTPARSSRRSAPSR